MSSLRLLESRTLEWARVRGWWKIFGRDLVCVRRTMKITDRRYQNINTAKEVSNRGSLPKGTHGYAESPYRGERDQVHCVIRIRQSGVHGTVVDAYLSTVWMQIRTRFVLCKLTPQRRGHIVISAARRYPISHGARYSARRSKSPAFSDYSGNLTWRELDSQDFP